jgi:aarF domain-containing kinase
MKTNLSDLIAALPREEAGSEVLDTFEARQRLQAIFADVANRQVPTGSLHRLWTLGSLSTQVTLAYTALWLRHFFADAATNERRAMETNLGVALKMIHHLGYLRGAATKLGQLLGSLPEILPEQVASTLDMLHFQAPSMHYSLLREMVRNELGKDPSEVFATFEKEPFAAASIGQVHRATLKSGEAVAVKIQYPGIGRAMEADLRNFTALLIPMRLTRMWESLRGDCKAIQDMMTQELDYVHEAQNMREARELFKPEENIVVPRVFEQYSTGRVLTAEFIPGANFAEFLASDPSPSVRDAIGAKIMRASYRMCFAYRSQGDPHSGNYVLMNGGRLGLLDFGCVQRFNVEERRQFLRADRFLEDPSTLPDLLRGGGFATEADLANEDYMYWIGKLWDWCVSPMRHEGAFDFGDTNHLKRGIELTRDVTLKRYSSSAPMYVYLSRSMFGLAALLLRLRARVDCRRIHLEELEIRLKRDACS